MYGGEEEEYKSVVVVQAFVGLFCGRYAHLFPPLFSGYHPMQSLFSPYSRGLFGISTIDAPILEISPADRSLILLVSLFCIVSSQIRIKNAVASRVPIVFQNKVEHGTGVECDWNTLSV